MYAVQLDGTRLSSHDFALPADIDDPLNMSFHGDNLYITNQGDDTKIHALDFYGTPIPADDLPLNVFNSGPDGIFITNEKYYVLDEQKKKMFTYNLSTKTHIPSHDFLLPAIISIPTDFIILYNRFYICDLQNHKIISLHLDGTRSIPNDVTLDAKNNDVVGITSSLIVGIQGPKGATGAKGVDGKDGATGAKGTDGKDGSDGKEFSSFPKLIKTAENIYFCDTDNKKVRKYNINTKQVTTLLGNWNFPIAIKLSPDGTYLVITDNSQLYKYVLSTDTFTILAGTGVTGDKIGSALSSQFGIIQDICFDKLGQNLFIADGDNHQIKILDLMTMMVSVFLGSSSGDVIGNFSQTKLNNPSGICLSSNGNSLFIADTGNHKIKETVINSKITSTLAGTGILGITDGVRGVGTLHDPQNLIAYQGVLYTVDSANHTIREVDEITGTIITIAGSAHFGDTDGIGLLSSFNNPLNITTNYNGNLIFSDTNNSKIKILNIATKEAKTIIGNGTHDHNGDKLGLVTAIKRPRGLVTDCIIQYPVATNTVLIPKITTFDADATFTPDTKTVYFTVEGVGAGASGGGHGTGLDTGGGGASGAYFKKIVRNPNGSYQIVIGIKGAEQTVPTADGFKGGDTTFIGNGINCIAKGGEGGHKGNDWATGGDGNEATGGDINIDGTPGGHGYDAGNANWMFSGIGGQSKLGSIGHALSRKPGQHQHQHPTFGSGGAGGNLVSNVAIPGQEGADGRVIITEYIKVEVV